MKPATFEEFRKIVYDRSGISLGPSKEALVQARVGKRLRALNFADSESYLDYLKSEQNDDELIHFIDAISTNVTSFFREPDHFVFMAEAIKKWLGKGQRRFRFWSAASSTGEEPFSMAITAREAMLGHDVDLRILATDISTQVLRRCMKGEYSKDKIESVAPNYRLKYFERVGAGQVNGTYRLASSLRSMITFSRLNLSATPFPMHGPMDIIFIRNVMIYFDADVRTRLLNEAHRLLAPGGFLMVGHSEGLTGMVCPLKIVQSSVYTK